MPEKLRQLYGQKFYGVTTGNGDHCILVYKSLEDAKKKVSERESVVVEVEITRVSTINPFLTEIERDAHQEATAPEEAADAQ